MLLNGEVEMEHKGKWRLLEIGEIIDAFIEVLEKKQFNWK